MKWFKLPKSWSQVKLASEFNIIGRRKLWYSLSLAVLLPCTLALIVFGLRLGIDFTGGSILEVETALPGASLEALAREHGLEHISLTIAGDDHWLIRYRLSDDNQAKQTELEMAFSRQAVKILRFDRIGPSVSRDLVKNAFAALGVMSLAIVFYIAWAFRKMPKGISALSFGLSTLIAAFFHDALFVLGAFAIMGRKAGVEVDTFIVTAILTVIGFSIHDTIVVLDRIREKVQGASSNFAKTVNISINETLVRSLNTSLVIVLVLLALFLFGGASTRFFILALLLGMISGTYSSIFIAAPLIVSWHERKHRRPKK